MIGLTRKSLITAALSVSATLIAGTAIAGEKPPENGVLCHNIGGPRDLGANCEATGNCTYATIEGQILFLTANQFLGILVGAQGEQAIAAHIAHGDGFVDAIFDPPLHLASVIGPHRASNVECLATRVLPQPPEPGN